MAHLINKDALVAEIKNLENTYKKCSTSTPYEEGLKDGRLIGYKDVLHIIDTLEVKDVDLDFMLHEYWNLSPKITIDCLESATMTKDEMIEFAKHFFELGLKAQNNS